AEQLERAGAMMRQVGVDADPAAVAAAVDAGDRIAIVIERLAVETKVMLAAELDRGVAHVDADALLATGAQPPELRRGQRRGRHRRLRRGSHRERRRQYRFRAGQR